MKWRNRLFALVIVVLAGLAWFGIHQREPRYQGRSLSSWLEPFRTNYWESDHRCDAAIQAIGTRATPFLLEMVARRESAAKTWSFKHVPRAWHDHLQLGSEIDYHQAINDTRRLGAIGFKALGEKARPAVPKLVVLLKDENPGVRFAAARSLHYLGPVAKDAVPALVNSCNDSYFKAAQEAKLAVMEWKRIDPAVVASSSPPAQDEDK